MVRVFISSTFDDLHTERDLLIKQVFPELRNRLRDVHLPLTDVDLRWGLTRISGCSEFGLISGIWAWPIAAGARR